jgi:hypothetical protein
LHSGPSGSGGVFAGPIKIVLDLSLNGHVLLFTLTSQYGGLAFSVLPALRASRLDQRRFKAGRAASPETASPCSSGRVITRWRSPRYCWQARECSSALNRLESVDLRFNPEGILTMEVTSGDKRSAHPMAGGAGGSA